MAGLAAAGAIVAIASRQPMRGSRGRTVTVPPVSGQFAGLLMLGSVAFGVAMILLTGVLGGPLRKRTPEHEEEEVEIPWQLKLFAAVFLFLFGGGMVAAAILGLHDDRRRGPPPLTLGSGVPHGQRSPRVAPPAFVVPGWLLGLVVGLAIAALLTAVGLIVARRRRARLDEETVIGEGSPAAAAVAAASEALAAGSDPRSAVIRAYLAMQQTLAARGIEPRVSEAPREFLQRALGGVGELPGGGDERPGGGDLVDAGAGRNAAGTLTGLFEEARFSVHPITEAARGRAADALRALRIALQEAAG